MNGLLQLIADHAKNIWDNEPDLSPLEAAQISIRYSGEKNISPDDIIPLMGIPVEPAPTPAPAQAPAQAPAPTPAPAPAIDHAHVALYLSDHPRCRSWWGKRIELDGKVAVTWEEISGDASADAKGAAWGVYSKSVRGPVVKEWVFPLLSELGITPTPPPRVNVVHPPFVFKPKSR